MEGAAAAPTAASTAASSCEDEGRKEKVGCNKRSHR